MSIYIIRPKVSLVESFTTFIAKKFVAQSREAQINEILSIRTKDPIDQEIRRWITDESRNPKIKVIDVFTGKMFTRITGTTIVDMPDTEAERMRQELPNALILRDQPIGLIHPSRTVASTKKKLTVKDLWHQSAIGLNSVRKLGFKATGKGVTVAVLDTGVDSTHFELELRVSEAYTFKNLQAQPMSPSQDTLGHGTHVAGLICGKKVGIAPGAKIINGVMIPQGNGNLSGFINALEWAATKPEVQIVNMSAGIRGYVPEMHAMVEDLLAVGVLPVVAIGNEGRNRTRSPGNYSEVVSVGASNRSSHVASFSSSGNLIVGSHSYMKPDLVAPGEGICSCVPGGGYETLDGTSMATAIVSGVTALILETYPNITVHDLIEALLSTCKDLGEHTERQGKGLVQVKAAI